MLHKISQLLNNSKIIWFHFSISCAVALGNLTLSDVKKVCILLTISKAWCLGRAVHRAQLAKVDPVMAVTTSMNGKLIISGKVCMMYGHTIVFRFLYYLQIFQDIFIFREIKVWNEYL